MGSDSSKLKKKHVIKKDIDIIEIFAYETTYRLFKKPELFRTGSSLTKRDINLNYR